MMLRMMLLLVKLRLRRSVRMRHLDIQQTPSAPAGCGFKQGAEECYDKTQTVVQDAPKENCSLEPQRTCKHVTKLVPKLTPTEECVDVPKEVCTRSRTNPRKV